MEDRVRRCSVENDELNKKIELLETQNKTLAGQLRRLHQIIVNGGLRQTQTSTAMMVLLLSTALFLIPGFKESQGAANNTIYILPSTSIFHISFPWRELQEFIF